MLKWTGERYLPFIDPSISGAIIHYEHLHRYAFASQFVKGKKVLDLASGEGYGTFLLSKNAASVVGIDMDHDAVLHASNTYKKENITFIEGSILQVPVAEEKIFDVIVCFEAIEHITEHDILLREITRLLKDDGILIISTPNKKNYSDDAKYNNPYHKKELYYADFIALLKDHFAFTYTAGQQVVSGSSIYPLSPEEMPSCSEFVIEREENHFSFSGHDKTEARYYIAFASNRRLDPEWIQKSFLIDKSNTEVVLLNSQIRECKTSAQSLKQDLSVKDKQLLEANANIKNLESALTGKDPRLLEANENVKNLEQALTEKAAQLLEANANIKNLESFLTEQNARLEDAIVAEKFLAEAMSASEEKIQKITAQNESLEVILREAERKKTEAEQKTEAEKLRNAEFTETINNLKKNIKNLKKSYKIHDKEHIRLQNRAAALKQKIADMEASSVWKLTTRFHTKIIDPLLPNSSRRRDLYDLGLKGGRIVVNEGFGKLLSEYKNRRASITNPLQPKKATSSIKRTTSSSTPSDKKSPASQIQERNSDQYSNLYHIFNAANTKSSDYVPLSRKAVSLSPDDIKFIAFYLPQFHPIPENNLWWGKGFTEWTNVSKAIPQFEGHYQPHLPDELGFYDLRLTAVQRRQVALAKHYGIYGFCFYYYWFNGKKLLEKPLNQYLDHKEMDLPFCICWANENWTRRWDGMENEILIAQDHSAESDIEFIRDIEHILRDPRYIKIGGKPLLIIYRATLLPEPRETLQRWRDYCREAGIGEIYVVAAHTFGFKNPTQLGFDAGVEFPPHVMPGCPDITNTMKILNPNFSGTIWDYERFVNLKQYLVPTPFTLFKTVATSWDNTPRRSNNPSIFHGANPRTYKKWLFNVSRFTQKAYKPDERLVFINAWNEWAEGTHLEPDRKYGYGYLQATSEVLLATRNLNRQLTDDTAMALSVENLGRIAVVIHLFYSDLLDEFISSLKNIPCNFDIFISVPAGNKESTEKEIKKHFPDAGVIVEEVENIGYDIYPFVCVFSLQYKNYDLILKIHGKKSEYNPALNLWRKYMMKKLLGSRRRVEKILKDFQDNPRLGLQYPDYFPPVQEHVRWGYDFPIAQKLLSEQNIILDETKKLDFPAGSMFWFRPEALSDLFRLPIAKDDFRYKLATVPDDVPDGTLAHAIERIIGILVEKRNFSWRKI
jgi:lipopolysaccharide biosynthesis protein/ubiquinone/menaquinone biosynthesis C-methylase UbiE